MRRTHTCEVKRAVGRVLEGDELELDVRSATIRNLSSGAEIQGRPYAPEMVEILEKGGLLNMLKEKLVGEAGG